MQKASKNVTKMLRSRALELTERGYSVIPIHGNNSASEPKKPTIRWRSFQERIAEKGELKELFDGRAGALGVVCGRVSQLLVIDFDDHMRYQRFCRHLPQYQRTYTVKTRRGYHMYFQTAEKVPSHQFAGGDIKGERSYVVTAPSVIAGFEYKVVDKRTALRLDKDEIGRMLTYFHGQVRSPAVQAPFDKSGDSQDLVALYRRLSLSIGRNNALYRAARLGRDQGLKRVDVEERLLGLHVVSPGTGEHKFETAEERYVEGKRTISSAWRSSLGYAELSGGIPNSVRERLLQAQGSAVTARLLDIMYTAGWEPESFFRLRDAIVVSRKFGLNRKSVLAALTGEHSIYNGRQIVARRYVEYMDIGGLIGGGRGRPVQLVFQVPSVSRLLSVLDVSMSPSDQLCAKDLGSSHAYRRALHREYVKRLSPRQSMGVLADRLGMSARSLRRYNAELGVRVSERVGRFALTWQTLKCLPQRERDALRNQTPGYWLAIGDSARFPAWRHIGAELLRRGLGSVQICARRTSVLSLGLRDARGIIYEPMDAELFLRMRLSREGKAKGSGILARLRSVVNDVSKRVVGVRYEKLRLCFDSVSAHIAEDKVAETINGYLFARDSAGAEVRRPARRGVAYRMLKEFGEGNVFLALRESYGELLMTMARHALGAGDVESGVRLLARSLA